MANCHTFTDISLVGHGGTNPGHLTVNSRVLQWKKQGGGGKAVQLDNSDIVTVTWMKLPRSNELGVLLKHGLKYTFVGFRVQDVAILSKFFEKSCNVVPQKKQFSFSGKNWGEVDINSHMLSFLVDDGGKKQAFEVDLSDVSRTRLVDGTKDVVLKFDMDGDDNNGDDNKKNKDSLMELRFHVPDSNAQFTGAETRPSVKVFQEKIMSTMAARKGGQEAAVVAFERVQVINPRGRFDVRLHLSYLRLIHGSGGFDFKIRYSNVVRVFVLPESRVHTYVVVTLDRPIRKGKTVHPHIVMKFDSDNVVERTLVMSKLQASKYKDGLEPTYKGLIHEVLATILRGLSGTKIARPGKFRSCKGGYGLKCSVNAEVGVLYPLEKSFLFVPKPPVLILHGEIAYAEFESRMQYFDLVIRLKTDQEHVFRNLDKSEYHNLYAFIRSKGIRIMNLQAQGPDRVGSVLQDGEDDTQLERIRNANDAEDSDEEDEDFVADKDDDGSPSDDSDSDGGDSGGEKERMPIKDPAANSKASSSKNRTNDNGSLNKRKQKKNDSNAPKKPRKQSVMSQNK